MEDKDFIPVEEPELDAAEEDTSLDENNPTEPAPTPRLEDDIAVLSAKHPELGRCESPEELIRVERYEELRALGLSEEEAYLATARRARRPDNRQHLTSSVTGGVGSPSSAMSERELRAARELFYGMSDAEIRRLYKKVSV